MLSSAFLVVLRSNTNRSSGGIDQLFTSDHEPGTRACYVHHRARAKRRHMPNMPTDCPSAKAQRSSVAEHNGCDKPLPCRPTRGIEFRRARATCQGVAPSVRAIIAPRKSLAGWRVWTLEAGAFGISVTTDNSRVGCR